MVEICECKSLSLHKKISKKKSSWCRDESMNTLADKAQKQGMPHSVCDMHSITRPHCLNGSVYIAGTGPQRNCLKEPVD